MPELDECLNSVTLDPATLRAIAEKELSEKPSNRKKGLREMRDYIKSSAHFQNCRTDSSFLLRFLRWQKFKVQDAQTVLDKYIKMRTQHPNWFQNLDIRDPKLNELIRRGYIFALPMRDAKGRRVVFSRAAAMDASRLQLNKTLFTIVNYSLRVYIVLVNYSFRLNIGIVMFSFRSNIAFVSHSFRSKIAFVSHCFILNITIVNYSLRSNIAFVY
jgi:hypothetical protein